MAASEGSLKYGQKRQDGGGDGAIKVPFVLCVLLFDGTMIATILIF